MFIFTAAQSDRISKIPTLQGDLVDNPKKSGHDQFYVFITYTLHFNKLINLTILTSDVARTSLWWGWGRDA